MAFVRDDIPRGEIHNFNSIWYYDNNGSPMIMRARAVDYERDIFLVEPGGSKGGTEQSSIKYVLKMENYYFSFQGFWRREERNERLYFEISKLNIPMNWAPRAIELKNIIEEASRVLLGSFTEPYKGLIEIKPPEYLGAMWCLEPATDLFLIGIGRADDYHSYEERFLSKYLFSQGEREYNTLYNFRMWYLDWCADFQARYRSGETGHVWEVERAAVPGDLWAQHEAMINQIPFALQQFSLTVDGEKIFVDVSAMELLEGPAQTRQSEYYGPRYYRSKFWGFIPNAPIRSARISLPELDKYWKY